MPVWGRAVNAPGEDREMRPLRTAAFMTAKVILELMADCPPPDPTEEYLRMKADLEEIIRQDEAS